MELIQHCLRIPITSSSTLDELLTSFHIAKKQRYFLYKDHNIALNGLIVSQSKAINPGDIIEITVSSQRDSIPAWNQAIDICYEDELFLIVNKASGVLVHSDGVNQTHTLCNAVKYYYDQTNQDCLVRPLHRLDVETSGLLMFCKIPFFQPLLDHQLEAKEIHREYEAIVQGVVSKPVYDIRSSIARDRHQSNKMRLHPQGKPARTVVTLLQQHSQIALVHCRLYTGRTHQIRVHLASIHHPILSDPLYGKLDRRISRCALHASSMSFYHPILEKQMQVSCALPTDMKNLMSH